MTPLCIDTSVSPVAARPVDQSYITMTVDRGLVNSPWRMKADMYLPTTCPHSAEPHSGTISLDIFPESLPRNPVSVPT